MCSDCTEPCLRIHYLKYRGVPYNTAARLSPHAGEPEEIHGLYSNQRCGQDGQVLRQRPRSQLPGC